MYRLPKDYDATFLIGRELIEICFLSNVIVLVFDEEVSISLLSSFVHNTEGVELRGVVPVASSQLMRLIGTRVQVAKGDTDGTLTLTFDDGQILGCLDDSDQYESYHIRNGMNETVV